MTAPRHRPVADDDPYQYDDDDWYDPGDYPTAAQIEEYEEGRWLALPWWVRAWHTFRWWFPCTRVGLLIWRRTPVVYDDEPPF